MATYITEECINCGACEPECPNEAISEGEDIYVIDPKLCTECVGFHDHEACQAVCPVEFCLPDPNRPETEDALITGAKSLHPDKEFGETYPSRLRQSCPTEHRGYRRCRRCGPRCWGFSGASVPAAAWWWRAATSARSSSPMRRRSSF